MDEPTGIANVIAGTLGIFAFFLAPFAALITGPIATVTKGVIQMQNEKKQKKGSKK